MNILKWLMELFQKANISPPESQTISQWQFVEFSIPSHVNDVFIGRVGHLYHLPIFVRQEYEEDVKDGRWWIYPTGKSKRVARFAFPDVGEWWLMYEGEKQEIFNVGQGDHAQPINIEDGRFVYADGEEYYGQGYNRHFKLFDAIGIEAEMARCQENDINLIRDWLSSHQITWSAWGPWWGVQGTDTVPRNGLLPILKGQAVPAPNGTPLDDAEVALCLDDSSAWFTRRHTLRREQVNIAVKPNARYGVHVKFATTGGTLKLRIGNREYVITDTRRSGSAHLSWQSGNEWWLPDVSLSVEGGRAYVTSVDITDEDGISIMPWPSFSYHEYICDRNAYLIDKLLDAAAQHGVYLKLVCLEKNDTLVWKMGDGVWVSGDDEHIGNFYAGSTARHYQERWWQYVKARWGDHPVVHSWELLNEGDPGDDAHWAMANDFAAAMGDEKLVTTSNWTGYHRERWEESDLDYADIHQYFDTPPFGEWWRFSQPFVIGECGFNGEPSEQQVRAFIKECQDRRITALYWHLKHLDGRWDTYKLTS